MKQAQEHRTPAPKMSNKTRRFISSASIQWPPAGAVCSPRGKGKNPTEWQNMCLHWRHLHPPQSPQRKPLFQWGKKWRQRASLVPWKVSCVPLTSTNVLSGPRCVSSVAFQTWSQVIPAEVLNQLACDGQGMRLLIVVLTVSPKFRPTTFEHLIGEFVDKCMVLVGLRASAEWASKTVVTRSWSPVFMSSSDFQPMILATGFQCSSACIRCLPRYLSPEGLNNNSIKRLLVLW